jgi:hypothetical protein
MRKIITASLAALTLAGGMAAASSADARPHGRHHGGSGAAVAAGFAGLVIGAALASSSHDRYDDRGYGYDRSRGYYRDGYFYGPPERAYAHYYGTGYYGRRHCVTRRVWDSYWGEYTLRTRCRR